jgi:indolepyruvate decarboxylase
MKSHLSVGQALLNKLSLYGVREIFGIPGDYVIRFNKLIEEHKKIRFINATREDSAGYMADAYGRIKGMGVACITYGVGINIANAVAQAYVESSPLVVISGAPSEKEYVSHHLLHHLINKSYTVYRDTTQLEIFKQMTIAQTVLDDPKIAATEIDRVLHACFQHKKPVYIEIPRDSVDASLSSLSHYKVEKSQSDPAALKKALEDAVELIEKSKKPVIWAGRDITAHGLTEELMSLVEKFNIPVVSSLLGKTVIDENHPLFIGVYQGILSKSEIKNFIKTCDAGLVLGVLESDVNTGFFTDSIDGTNKIIVNPCMVKIGHHVYPDVFMKDFIKGLSQIKLRKSFKGGVRSSSIKKKSFKAKKNARITTSKLFECLQSNLANNFIATDVGDCLFGSTDLILSMNSFYASAYFAALGSGLPGALGSVFALPKAKRVIALIGDGGFQMSALELSTAARYGLNPIIILFNNHGFGTERPLAEGRFNEILNWNYSFIPLLLGGGIGCTVKTEEEFDNALKDAIQYKEDFCLIEVDLAKEDYSEAMKRFNKIAPTLI